MLGIIGSSAALALSGSISFAGLVGEDVAAALISPLMAIGLGATALALIAGGLWLRGRPGAGDDGPLGPLEDPPLLETTLIAPERVEGGRRFAAGFALAGIAKTTALILLVAMAIGTAARLGPSLVSGPELAGRGGAAEPLPAPAPAIAGNTPGALAVLADAEGGCIDAGAAHSGAFTVCGGGLALRFERLAFSRDGERLSEPVWAGAGRRAVLAEAKGLPVPFTFDRRTGLVAPPGGQIAAYDAFVAIGFGDEEVDGKAAKARAESRGYALQDFTLGAIRDGAPGDCRAKAVVHAVSLGAKLSAVDGPRPQPVLIGVRAENRINGDAAAVDDMLSALFEGQGATGLLGLVPDAYGPWTVLSSEEACPRPALAGRPF